MARLPRRISASSGRGLGVKYVYENGPHVEEKHGKDAGVITIGPAGERLVRLAAWINVDDRAAARGGTAAVGGSKNLKAIVVLAEQKSLVKPTPERKEEFDKAQKVGLKAIMSGVLTAPRKGGLSLYGTNVLMNIINETGSLPAYNGRDSHFENAYALSGEHIRETILVSEPVCHACPGACKKEVEVKEGRWKVRTESFEFESAWALGAMCGMSNKDAVAYMIDQCNEYGLDTIEMGVRRLRGRRHPVRDRPDGD